MCWRWWSELINYSKGKFNVEGEVEVTWHQQTVQYVHNKVHNKVHTYSVHCKLLLNNRNCNKLKKYPARCESVDKNLAINVIHTAKYRKYMPVGFAINVIQTAKNRKYMHIELSSCSSWTHKHTFIYTRVWVKLSTFLHLQIYRYSTFIKYSLYSTY
jgi:hypothetical protein